MCVLAFLSRYQPDTSLQCSTNCCWYTFREREIDNTSEICKQFFFFSSFFICRAQTKFPIRSCVVICIVFVCCYLKLIVITGKMGIVDKLLIIRFLYGKLLNSQLTTSIFFIQKGTPHQSCEAFLHMYLFCVGFVCFKHNIVCRRALHVTSIDIVVVDTLAHFNCNYAQTSFLLLNVRYMANNI